MTEVVAEGKVYIRNGDGVEELYRAFKEHGLEEGDLTGARFQRIAQIRQLMDRGQVDADLRRR